MASEIDPFYHLYKDAGFVPIEIGTNGALFLIAFVGVCFNLCLIYMTFKTKELHSPCNILIGLLAFFSSFVLISSTIKFFVFLFAINFISVRLCFCLQISYFVSATFSMFLQLFIAIDRFVGIAFPLWYKSRLKYSLIKLAFGVSFCMSTEYLIILYIGCSKHWEKQVMCSITELILMPEDVNPSFGGIGIYLCEFFCYLSIWAIILCRKEQMPLNVKKFVVSLNIIMTINFCCFVSTIIFTLLIMPNLKIDVFTLEYAVGPICNAFYLMANGSTMPVLCICSQCFASKFFQIRQMHVKKKILELKIRQFFKTFKRLN